MPHLSMKFPRQSSSLTRLSLSVALGLWLLNCRAVHKPPPAEAIRHNNLGVALMDAGVKDPKYFAEAIKEFESALKLAPYYRTSRINLGMALYYAGQADQSQSTLEALAKEAPDSLHVQYMLGLLKETKGHFREARQHFSAVARQDPQDPNGWYHLGYCFSKEREYQQAVDPFRRAAELVPYQRRIRYNLYMALNRAGKAAEAQIELERFRQLENSAIRVVEAPKSAVEYLKQGKYAEAISESLAVPVSPKPAPRYTNVAAELGVVLRSARTLPDMEIQEILKGKPRTRDWYLDTKNQARLMAALSSGAAFCDYNNDGRLDLFLVTASGAALYEQRSDGRFLEITKKAGLGWQRPGMACAWGDYDNDGWSDLLMTHYGALRLYRNKGGSFEDVTAQSGLTKSVSATAVYMGAAFADLDHDGDTDLYVSCLLDLAKSAAQPEMRFPSDFAGGSNLLFRNNSNGTFNEMARQAKVDAELHGSRDVWFSDVNEDRAIDFVLLGSGGRYSTFVNNKDGTFAPADLTAANLPAPLPLGESHAYGDFNRDGALDELVLNDTGVALNRNNSRPSHWLAVRLEGYAVPGKVKSNKLGIGTKVEVRSVGRWERQELRAGNGMRGSDAPLLYFDLGNQPEVDFVRAIFPSGVRWTVQNVRANQTITIREPLLDVNSCPTLFAWNGGRFEFVTDTLSAGILGELIAPQRYWHADPDEWLRVTGDQLQVNSHNTLDLRFTNPLEEVTYLDQVRLLAVDHPASVEVYTDERMVSQPENRRPIRFFAVANARPLAQAVDHHGHDVTGWLARSDRQYFDCFRLQPFKGFAEDWSLSLDLGRLSPGAEPVLLMHGWSYWNSSASIVSATQAGKELRGPVLDVLDKDGRWRTVLADMGVFAGLPRTLLLDLSNVLKGSRRVRIRSNRMLYFDQIWVADLTKSWHLQALTQLGGGMQARVSPLRSAQLRWLGYPRRVLPDGKLPEVFDYTEILQQAEWGTHTGYLTRYGDVLPLLLSCDDQLVVMEHGEEVALSFDASQLPPLAPGWKRTFFFYSDGFEKGYELHSGQAETVESLPFHAMGSYPYDRRIAPRDEAYWHYVIHWNTRPSYMRW